MSKGSPHGLDDTIKGRRSLAQVVLTLRARDLRWGILTDSARWRLVDAQDPVKENAMSEAFSFNREFDFERLGSLSQVFPERFGDLLCRYS